METKVCNKCGIEQPIEEFVKNPMSKGGRICSCRRCNSKLQRTPETIKCLVCKQELPFYKFDLAYKSPTGRRWCCKECWSKLKEETGLSDNALRRRYDPEFNAKSYEQKKQDRWNHFVHYMWKAAKDRAEKRGLEFNIEEGDIIIPDRCPLLNVPIEFGTKEDYNRSPSLDRIDNTKGYIKGNVWVISKKANLMKSSATLEELQTFCKNVLRYSPSFTKQEGKETGDKELL